MTDKKIKKELEKKESAKRHRNLSETGKTPKQSRTGSNQSAKKQLREQEVHHAKVMIFCGVTAVLLLIFLIFGLPRLSGSFSGSRGSLSGVNSDVLKYEDKVKSYCKKYNISQFSTLMLAIMQQESSGQGTDIFQCSESPFNTEYANTPGSITDTDYSIRVGVETFAYCLEQAGCTRISDMDKVKLALQEYNFGNDYINWAVSNYGGYSRENAWEFSEMMKAQLGWDTYGDPEYVQHVLQYYEQ